MSRATDTPSAPIAMPDVALVTHGLLGCAEADFPRFARAFRSELAPRDLCEGLQVDLAIMALMLLRKALAALMAAPSDPKRLRAHASAHKMLTQALREFARLRKAKTAIPAATKAVAVAPPPKPAETTPTDRGEIAVPTGGEGHLPFSERTQRSDGAAVLAGGASSRGLIRTASA